MTKALRCGCGRRLQAQDDEGLFTRLAAHLGEEHPAAAFDDGRARAFVAHAYELQYAAPYPRGVDGPDEQFGPEPY